MKETGFNLLRAHVPPQSPGFSFQPGTSFPLLSLTTPSLGSRASDGGGTFPAIVLEPSDGVMNIRDFDTPRQKRKRVDEEENSSSEPRGDGGKECREGRRALLTIPLTIYLLPLILPPPQSNPVLSDLAAARASI